MDEFDQIRGLLHEVRDLAAPIGVGNAQISVNAGGVGVWVATTACIVSVVLTLVLAVIVLDQNRKIDRLGDYLQAIYAQAPQLKPQESK